MIDLTDGQYEVDGLLLGTDTAYVVREFEDGGTPGRRVGDESSEYDDGRVFGRDELDGMTLNFDVLVETAGGGDSHDAVARMVATWRGDTVRRTPGAVQVLRVKRPGAPARRVYGRSRACTPIRSRNTGVGLVPVVATFDAADDRWYGDTPDVHVLGVAPSTTGGIVTQPGGGIVSPITTATPTSRPGSINHTGDVEAWPVVVFRGPVTNPSLELFVDGGRRWVVGLSATLADGEAVTIDTRPWVRTVLRGDGANYAGKRSPGSTPMSRVVVPPGQSALVFRGTSPGGTGRAELRYEPAFSAY